ncbi:hypothetical protein [Falsiroseomonas sp. HW251]|uniref:hypothetical protein n=1 Tax=Falsiroseomonas sp. HW251 TaxID=3390998 RepID=UPI003D314E39
MAGDSMPPAAAHAGEAGLAVAHTSAPWLLLSLDDCSLSAATGVGQLRRTSAAILATLAGRRREPIGARELAELLAIRTGVDPISAARAAVTLLRSELRVLGLADLVRSRRGLGYWIAERYELRVVGTFPHDGPGRGPARVAGPRALPSLLDAVDSLADPAVERIGPTAMLPFGILDIEDRSLCVAGHRVGFESERDFNLFAATALAGGRPVGETLLMRLCGFSAGPFGAEILRRTVRRLNLALGRKGLAVAVEPLGKAYGSPYRLADGQRPNATKPQSNRHAAGTPPL